MKLQDILNARAVIKPYISETPLVQLEHVNKLLGCQIYFKLENMQIGNAFKIRGPSNKLQVVKSNRIVAASSGNHGIGISYAAKLLGKKAIVIVPLSTPKEKLEKINGGTSDLCVLRVLAN